MLLSGSRQNLHQLSREKNRASGAGGFPGRRDETMPRTCRGRRPWLRVARGKCAKDSQQPNIVSVAKERADIDKLSIADLTKRSRNFLFRVTVKNRARSVSLPNSIAVTRCP